MSEPKLTVRQQTYLDLLVQHGGSTVGGYDRRVYDALVRKGLVMVQQNPATPWCGWYTPTELGRASTAQARNLRKIKEGRS